MRNGGAREVYAYLTCILVFCFLFCTGSYVSIRKTQTTLERYYQRKGVIDCNPTILLNESSPTSQPVNNGMPKTGESNVSLHLDGSSLPPVHASQTARPFFSIPTLLQTEGSRPPQQQESKGTNTVTPSVRTVTGTPSLRSPVFFQRESLESTQAQHASTHHDVTFTSQGTIARYSYFPILLKRWSGPFSIALCVKSDEADAFAEQLEASHFDSRLSIVQYIVDDNVTYPINKLRNLAIRNSRTDHFWLTDLDMWPSDRLYQTLLSLPESVLSDDHHAIIVPAFEIYARNCNSFANCSRAVDLAFPGTKDALIRCIRFRKCNRFRPWDGLHDYHSPRWMMKSFTQELTSVPCFKGNTQEPYVMVRKSADLPPFDERFANYGYNKVQWLEHLRYRGFAFSVLTNGFAVDVPHPLCQPR